MKDDLQSLTELKRKIGAAQARAERAAGVLDQILATLKREWGCSTIEEAKEKLKALTKRADRLSSEFREKSQKFEEVWGDELRRLS